MSSRSCINQLHESMNLLFTVSRPAKDSHDGVRTRPTDPKRSEIPPDPTTKMQRTIRDSVFLQALIVKANGNIFLYTFSSVVWWERGETQWEGRGGRALNKTKDEQLFSVKEKNMWYFCGDG